MEGKEAALCSLEMGRGGRREGKAREKENWKTCGKRNQRTSENHEKGGWADMTGGNIPNHQNMDD